MPIVTGLNDDNAVSDNQNQSIVPDTTSQTAGLDTLAVPDALQAPDGTPQLAPPTAAPSLTGAPANSPTGSGVRDQIVSLAMRYLGTPYVWGGTRPGGFDCSGLVQYVFGKNGVKLPRISYQQADAGHKVSIKNLQPGDLVAWDENSRNPGADHIAIFAGYRNGKPEIIEAPHTGADVRLRILGADEGAWGVSMNI